MKGYCARKLAANMKLRPKYVRRKPPLASPDIRPGKGIVTPPIKEPITDYHDRRNSLTVEMFGGSVPYRVEKIVSFGQR